MAQVKWINASGGDFNNGANWSTGTPPGSGDDALLTTAGSYTVTSTQSNTVHSVQIVTGVTLEISAGSIFTSSAGTGSGANAGTILVDNNCYFDAAGTLAGAGTINLNSAGNATDLRLEGNTTLSGGGKLTLSDNSQNYVLSDGGPYTLTNVNDVISGAGQFLINNTSFVNGAGGVLNANAAGNALTVNPGTGAISNAGLMEATGNGGLFLQSGTITQTGTGAIKAIGSGHNVSLYTVHIVGGTLATSGGGIIQNVNESFIDNVTIAAVSTVAVQNNTYLHVADTITNKGTVQLNSAGNGTRLILDTATVTLTGGGKLALSDNSQNYIVAAASGNQLINVNNTISGAGQLAYNGASIDNQKAGVINATGAAALVLDSGGIACFNEGLMEATGSGGLQIINQTSVTNSGTIGAFGANAHVDLAGGADIIGGTLSTSGGGVIQSIDTGTLDGSTKGAITITAGSQIAVQNNEYLYAMGTISNGGTIALNSAGNGTRLSINSPVVTLTGGGKLVLSDNSQNYIFAVTNGNKLINVNNTISGAGQLAYNFASIDNQKAGVINATGAAALVLDSGGIACFNEGLMEATGSGGLQIVDHTSVTNTGTIGAFGANAHVDLASGADIIGGTLSTSGGGVIQSLDTGTLDGSTKGAITITAGSQIAVQNNEYLYAMGTISNGGTIALNSAGNGTRLSINSPLVTLTGGGKLVLSDNSQNYIFAVTNGNKLINVNNTISGAGQLAYNFLQVDNQAAGVINSNGTNALVADSGGAAFSNEGLMKSTSSGGLKIVNGTTIVNTGTIAAIGAGAHVDLASGGAIAGGTITTSNGGLVQSVDTGTLDGSTAAGAINITANSQLAVQNNDYLYLAGTITNAGTIALNSGGNNTSLWVASPVVTLNGGGTILLSDNSQNYLRATATGNQLVNVNDTISGAGNLAFNFLAIDNRAGGVINATGGNALNFQSGQQLVSNEGLIEATGAGGLIIQDTLFTNTGTLASMSDSSVFLQTNTNLTNLSNGTLTGGTFEAISAGGTHTSTLTITEGTIRTLSARLVISGAGASIVAGGTSVASTIATITAAGELDILGGASFTSGNALAVSGTLGIAGTVMAPSITTTARGVITASGTASLSTTGRLVNNGTIQATAGGALSLVKGSLSNAGSIIAQAGGSVTVTSAERNSNFSAGTLTGGTWAAIGAGAQLTIGSGVVTTDAAIITLSGNGSSIRTGAAGRTLETQLTTVAAGAQLNAINGRGFASSSAGLTDAGTISLGGGVFSDNALTIAAGGTFQGGGTLAGSVTDNGLLASSAAPSGNGNMLVTSGAITGSGTLQASGGTTLSAAGGFAVGSVTVLAGGTLAGAGSATGAITDSGQIVLSGGTLSGGSITVGAGAILSGAGTVATSVSSSGTIQASGGTLSLAAGERGGLLSVDGGATLAGNGVAAARMTILSGGSFIGSGSVTGNTADVGALTAQGGALQLNTVSGVGAATIASGATLGVTGTLSVNGGVAFTVGGSGETLALGTASGNTAAISGFSNGTTIDLLNASANSFVYAPKQGLLTLQNAGTTIGQLSFAGTYTKANFALASDGHGGTDILFTGSFTPGTPLADLQLQAAGAAATPAMSLPTTSIAQPGVTAAAVPQPSVMADGALPGGGMHPLDGFGLHIAMQ